MSESAEQSEFRAAARDWIKSNFPPALVGVNLGIEESLSLIHI